MATSNVKFYRGPKTSYNSDTHVDCIYFATDTLEILMNGQSYGGGIVNATYANDVLTLTLSNGETKTVTFPTATTLANGLMSKEDKAKLETTVNNLAAEIERATEAEEDLAESLYYYHATVTINANKTLIEKGVDTQVTLTATSSFKTEGANTLDIKTSGTTIASTGTTTRKTATVTITDTTKYQAAAVFDHNVSKTAEVTINAKYPIYTLGSLSASMNSETITSGTKAVKSSAAGSYNITLSLNLMYFWICVPSDMTVNKVTLSGFDVPMQAYQTVAVTGKGNYKCYRSTNTNDAGTYTLVVS